MKEFKWTRKLMKAADEIILAQANAVEAKKRKYLKNVRYTRDGHAVWESFTRHYSTAIKVKVKNL